MKRIVQTLNKFTLILENAKPAKEFALKTMIIKTGIDPETITDSQKVRLLRDSGVDEIIELVKANPSYAFLFTKMSLKYGTTMSQLQILLNKIRENHQFIGILPMQIDQYASDKLITTLDDRDPYERLMDDLNEVERNRSVNWLIKSFTKPVRDGFRALSKEDKERLVASIIDFSEKVKKSELIDEEGNDPMKLITSKLSAFKTITEFTNFFLTYVEQFGKGGEVVYKDAMSLEPGVHVMYYDGKYLALSIRSEEAQKQLCGSANWCLNRGSFWTYAGTGVQLNIFNFTIPDTNRYQLVGFTINYTSRNISHNHDKTDTSVSSSIGKNLPTALSNPDFNYPQKMIDVINKKLDNEIKVKSTLDHLFKGNVTDAITNLLKSPFDPMLDDVALTSTFAECSDVMRQRIEISNTNKESVYKLFLSYGATSSVTFELFRKIIQPNYEQLIEVKESTRRFFEKVKTILLDQYQDHVSSKKEVNQSTQNFNKYRSRYESKDAVLELFPM